VPAKKKELTLKSLLAHLGPVLLDIQSAVDLQKILYTGETIETLLAVLSPV
jgi:hypothetical protein